MWLHTIAWPALVRSCAASIECERRRSQTISPRAPGRASARRGCISCRRPRGAASGTPPLPATWAPRSAHGTAAASADPGFGRQVFWVLSKCMNESEVGKGTVKMAISAGCSRYSRSRPVTAGCDRLHGIASHCMALPPSPPAARSLRVMTRLLSTYLETSSE